MVSNAAKQLWQLQQALYEKAYEEAHAIVGGSSEAIIAYSDNFEASLPERFERTTQTELIEALRKKQFLLYGDFHTLRQSQRGLLRLLRTYTERLRTDKVVIALEMFKAKDQPTLNRYLDGRLSDDKFLERINYKTEWGFPWANFKMILDFAKQRGIRVIGINTDNAGRDSLAERDTFAARILADAAETHPGHKIVCLIGEYHLADNHLPAYLSAELKTRGLSSSTLRILNNVDRYYFQLQLEQTSHPTEYLKLRKDFYCIINSPPWVKWQSFSIWEEMRHSEGRREHYDEEDGDDLDYDPDDYDPDDYDGDYDAELASDQDFQSDEAFDVDYQFLEFAKHLATFLNLKIEGSDLEGFHVTYSRDGDFHEDLAQEERYSEDSIRRILERAIIDGVYFLPVGNNVLISSVSINNLAIAAGQYLHRLLTGFDEIGVNEMDSFYRRTIKAAIGMIASKILNPRRKCMELNDYRNFLRRYKGQKVVGFNLTRRELARAIVSHDEWIRTKIDDQDAIKPPISRRFFELDKTLNYELSRELGQMLGYELYKKVISNKASSTAIRRIFRKRLNSSTDVWQEIVSLYQLMLT